MVRVVNHRPGAVGLGRGHSQRLDPGFNDVDPVIWEAVKGSPMVAALLRLGKNGGLTVSGAPESTPESEPTNPPAAKATPAPVVVDDDPPESVTVPDLKAMNRDDAKGVIAECDDLDTLAEWLRAETRKTVIKAIDKRLATLQNDDD